MKKFSLILALTLFASFTFFMVAYAAEPDMVTIKSKVYTKHTKPLVKFTHKKHATDYKIACNDCHHVYKDGKNVWKKGDAVKACDSCHNVGKGAAQLSPEEKKKLASPELALHKNCKDCHTKAKAQGKNAPVACNQCHKP